MQVVKILWAALTGCISLLILLVTAWAHDVTLRTVALETRSNLIDQHFIGVQKDYQDLRERMQEMKEMIKEQTARAMR